jgi:hypothetical protein
MPPFDTVLRKYDDLSKHGIDYCLHNLRYGVEKFGASDASRQFTMQKVAPTALTA